MSGMKKVYIDGVLVGHMGTTMDADREGFEREMAAPGMGVWLFLPLPKFRRMLPTFRRRSRKELLIAISEMQTEVRDGA